MAELVVQRPDRYRDAFSLPDVCRVHRLGTSTDHLTHDIDERREQQFPLILGFRHLAKQAPPSPGRRYSPSMPDALRTPETPARSVRTIRQRPSLPPSTEVILNSKRRHGYQNGDYHEIPTFKGLCFPA